jgi:DNA-binding GntR family transcriptional regulator
MVERAAAELRERIMEGEYQPEDSLPEQKLADELQISRNTLREAFRLLEYERLLHHEHYKSIAVRRPTAAEVTDIYRVRTVVECAAVRSAPADHPRLADIDRSVEEGEQAVAVSDWRALGTANMHFHQSIAALADSPRMDELMRGVLAELRLVFHVVSEPKRLHEPYLIRNRELLAVIHSGDRERAAGELADYLADSERDMLAAYDTVK